MQLPLYERLGDYIYMYAIAQHAETKVPELKMKHYSYKVQTLRAHFKMHFRYGDTSGER